MGRLVVAAHLPHHRLTILVVVPQCGNTPLGGHRGGIDANLVVRRAGNNLLAPVAEQVTLIAGRSLRVVVGQ